MTYIWERLLLVRGVFHTCMYGCERNQNGVESVGNIRVGTFADYPKKFRRRHSEEREC